MPLLLLPLLVVALVLLWAMLLPLLLVQRYRLGKARRRQYAWVVAANAWTALPSAVLFLLGAWASGQWISGALPWAGAGLTLGLVLGVLGLCTSRFERLPEGLYLTPNRWLVLGLTVLVALRIVLGLWQAWAHWRHGLAIDARGMAGPASMLGVGGVLLGYFLAMSWGVRARLRRWRTAQDSTAHSP